jgi:cytochrome d ubiquinol oxidase subunit II
VDLPTIWFILIAILFTGYFFLEGFDFGVGILMPVIGKDDTDRRVVLNTIGPYWDANEVWLITAGGAMFAAFPHWYATLFSGFYLALFVILLALIVRIAGIEYRSKVADQRWRNAGDACIFLGSLLPALLWGVAITNIVRGVPIDATMNFTGNLLTLLNPYALLGGLLSTSVFVLHGALFLTLRTQGDLQERARRVAALTWLPVGVVGAAFTLWGYSQTDIFDRYGLIPGTLPMIAIAAFISVIVFVRLRNDGLAFAATGLTIVMGTAFAFGGLFPRVMVSSLGPAFNLTIYNASSSSYTLTAMTIVAAFFLPIVLLYQGWSYWVFRKRVTREQVESGSH